MLADWLRRITDHSIAPYSAGAFLFAVACVAAATVVRYASGFIHPDMVPFAAHFPAVLVVAMVAGVPAAVFATVLSIVTVIPLFGPPGPVTRLEIFNSIFFALSCLLMIVVAEAYRQLVARYRAQEKQKNLMVRELDHRGKNTFSVVEAIVSQTLAHDPRDRQGDHRPHPRGLVDQRHHQPRRQSAAGSAHADPCEVRTVRGFSRHVAGRRGDAAGGFRAQPVAGVPRTRHQRDQAWRAVASRRAHRHFVERRGRDAQDQLDRARRAASLAARAAGLRHAACGRLHEKPGRAGRCRLSCRRGWSAG